MRLKICGGDGGTLFYGTADIQREIVSGSGNRLLLTCRNLAGLLLDSEPVPAAYEFPCLAAIFARHLKPYGFTGFLGGTAIYRGPFRVTKGMSEWQAASGFCGRFLQTAPRVRGTVFDASGTAVPDAAPFGAGGTRYFRAEVRNRCCDRMTSIFAPDAQTGVYRLAAEDADAAAMGLVRNRCLTKSGTDAEALLKKARRSSFAVFADCPGAPTAEIGARTSLDDPILGSCGGLRVAEIRCELGQDGLWTRYCLRRDD